VKTDFSDENHLRLACELALRGKGRTRPNPMVGAVLVKNGRRIGTGYHRQWGSPHAEVAALRNATENPERATLYVNLEPCTHYGKTPPCVDAILAAKVRRVVIGTRDPNPRVNGRGVRLLRRHGVEVQCGVLEAECRRLNEVFFKFMETGKPFVSLKAALTLDGKIASGRGESQWISCAASRLRVHRLRSRVDAVLVGAGTVLRDDPQLTVRGVGRAANPRRILLDARLRAPLHAKILNQEAPTLVAAGERAPLAKVRKMQRMGISVELFPADARGRVPLAPLLRRLGEHGVQHLLVEGGSHVFTSFLEEEEADHFLLFLAPLFLGGATAPTLFGGRGFDRPSEGLKAYGLQVRKSDRDLLVEGRFRDPNKTRGRGKAL